VVASVLFEPPGRVISHVPALPSGDREKWPSG
jgi:hypothetical protein